ncbi:IclR family transcriptional regulator [Pollutimonas subterranea]|uniref:IclR family transcriptional regulator n=1 Tax=Pollutimonas subterranea TaxID=2045210 RepID=A0A2N4U5S7_9BURK|nr:IclR family transcriptional regulator [Pollutimonas subterranea]PLC50366.1 IclR family transcriptional regulator [Pollutimonas subterranea]
MRHRSQETNTAFATTVAHGLAVVECFRVGEPVLSNKDLVERTGLSKATISRLTYTLVLKGLLMYDANLRRYRLGSSLLSLSYPLLASMKVRQLARPYMKDLADLAGGSVSLGLYDKLHMVYVETSRGHDAIAFRPDIGARLPVLASAIGMTWLAQAPDPVRQDIVHTIMQNDPNYYSRNADSWRQAKIDFSRKGYCVSLGGWQSDVHAVAVPLPTPVNGDVMVFNCGVPVARLKEGQLEGLIAPRLLAMVREINALLEAS